MGRKKITNIKMENGNRMRDMEMMKDKMRTMKRMKNKRRDHK
jgi:hypothetical protein